MRERMKSTAIPPSLKERLGYDAATPDRELLKDWRSRTRHVCKPCWELKYCPYGPLVEQAPALPPDRAAALEHNEYQLRCLETGRMGPTEHEITDEERARFISILRDEQTLIGRAMFEIEQQDRVETSLRSKNPVLTFLLGSGPNSRMPKVDFKIKRNRVNLEEVDRARRTRIENAIAEDRAALEAALATGRYDPSEPLDPVRKMLFEQELEQFSPEDYPEECPEVLLESVCNIFGHFCPVFFCAEAWTETSEGRRHGRYIPFDVKMRVVRRDNYTCQECGVHLLDNEVEFDHIIPHSKGGSSEEHNIRLTCFDCNRDKRDEVLL
jgi:HNH endonuclease